MTVDFDDRGVDHGIFHVRLCRHRIEQPFENIRLHPVAVALEHRVPASERRRQIAPRAAGPNDPQHRLDKAPIVAPTPARIAWLPKAMGFHLRPLGVSQNKSIHPKLESQSNRHVNPKSQQALVCFAGNSLPVIGVGLLSAKAGPGTAHIVFAIVITCLAVVGLVVGSRNAAPMREGEAASVPGRR